MSIENKEWSEHEAGKCRALVELPLERQQEGGGREVRVFFNSTVVLCSGPNGSGTCHGGGRFLG